MHQLGRSIIPCLSLIAVLSSPFGILSNPFSPYNPSVSPLPIYFALGMLLGACASAFIQLDEHQNALVSKLCRTLNPLCLAAILLCSLLDWLRVVDYSEAEKMAGFFGSGVYVDVSGAIRCIAPGILCLAGIALTAAGQTPPRGLQNGFEKSNGFLELPPIGPMAALASAICTGGVLCRQILGATFAHITPAPIAALAATLMNSAILLLVSAMSERLQTTTGHLPVRIHVEPWIAIGIVLWGSTIRIVPVAQLLSEQFIAVVALTFVSLFFTAVVLSRRHRGMPSPEGPDQLEAALRLSFEKHGLAPRELEIALLYADGKTSGAIADLLGIKPATVRSALQRSYRKLGTNDRNGFLTFVKRAAGERNEGIYPTPQSATSHMKSADLRVRGNMALPIIYGVLLLIPGTIPTTSWGAWRPYIYAMGSLAVIVGFFLMERSELERRIDAVGLAFIGTSFALGSAWEELLRATGPYRLPDVLAPLELGVALISGFLLIKGPSAHRMNSMSLHVIPAATTGAALVTIVSWRLALFAVTLLFAAYWFHQASHRDQERRSLSGTCLFAFGIASMATDVLANRYADMLWGNDGWTQPFGGRTAFSAYCLVLIALFSVVILVVYITGVRQVIASACAERHRPSVLETSGRGWHFLISRGISETQATVLLLVARGKSSDQIARELHYSRGTINTARREGYARLKVHDRLQLIELLYEVDNA